MKNNIKTFLTRLGERNVKITSVFVVVFAVVGIAVAQVGRVFVGKENQATAAAVMSTEKSRPTLFELVSVVGEDGLVGNKEVSGSWPGELISSEISQIQPQRQGVIVDWRVNVGDVVSAGDILGKISAPPATPELIKMLAEQTEAVAKARAEALVADEFAVKERDRLSGLKEALDNDTASNSGFTFTSLLRLREKRAIKMVALRSFVERAISGHVATITNVFDYRSFRYGNLNRSYGLLNQEVQNAYESMLLTIIEKLKKTTDTPIEEAQTYFALAVRLANSSGDNDVTNVFRATASADQKEFLDFLADYREAEAELADKETEYKIMISEKGAMVERDRSMAHAEADASEAAYATVSKEINGGSYIISPRAGTVSAIYKKVGDLVQSEMPIAVVAGHGNKNLIVRMRIPGNIRKPAKGDIFSVMRPGFPNDLHQAKLVGIGSSLDDTGSYMADAILTDRVDWPALASVRVIASADSNAPVIKLSSVWRSDRGVPHVWAVSSAGRIFAKTITIGRTLGASVEVYDGIKKDDRYISSPTPEMQENMLLEDLVKVLEPTDSSIDSSAKSGGHDSMEGMEM